MRGWAGLHARPGVELLPIHRQAGISRHPTAGGHEGPPVHPPPPSPLLTSIAIYLRTGLVAIRRGEGG